MKLRLGTRGSELARTQATTIARCLEADGFEVELVIISTSGDQSTAPSFGAIGPQGVFVREIEQALLDGAIDLAVHSYKDLPTESPAELSVAAVPQRVDVADLLIAQPTALGDDHGEWLKLAPGARVGTASARRRVWLEHFRPDLVVTSLRGNVPTRLKRLEEGRYDAIMLAAAGIERLAAGTLPGLSRMVVQRLDPQRFVPAPAQGALALQCRGGHAVVVDALAKLDHPFSRQAVEAERAALALAEGGCDTAFGAYCAGADDAFSLIVMLERRGAIRTARVRAVDSKQLASLAFAELETGDD